MIRLDSMASLLHEAETNTKIYFIKSGTNSFWFREANNKDVLVEFIHLQVPADKNGGRPTKARHRR